MHVDNTNHYYDSDYEDYEDNFSSKNLKICSMALFESLKDKDGVERIYMNDKHIKAQNYDFINDKEYQFCSCGDKKVFYPCLTTINQEPHSNMNEQAIKVNHLSGMNSIHLLYGFANLFINDPFIVKTHYYQSITKSLLQCDLFKICTYNPSDHKAIGNTRTITMKELVYDLLRNQNKIKDFILENQKKRQEEPHITDELLKTNIMLYDYQFKLLQEKYSRDNIIRESYDVSYTENRKEEKYNKIYGQQNLQDDLNNIKNKINIVQSPVTYVTQAVNASLY